MASVLFSPCDLALHEVLIACWRHGQETTASATRAVLRNSTFSITLAPYSIPFTSFSSHATLHLPSHSSISPGAYSFIVLEDSDEDKGNFATEAAEVAVKVVKGSYKRAEEGVEKREPHPAGITEPEEGATLEAGGSVHVHYTDGVRSGLHYGTLLRPRVLMSGYAQETTADKVQVLLRPSSGGDDVTLGSGDFSNFAYDGDLTIPSDTPAGSYRTSTQTSIALGDES